MSIGHEFIRSVLLDHGVRFAEEKRFKELPGYRFDFYATEECVLFEYDGIQHFQAVELFGGNEELAKTRRRDRKKDEWARANGLPLVRVRFDMPDNEIRSAISAALNKRVLGRRTSAHSRRLLKRQRR